MKISLAHVCFTVRDLDRALAFYQYTLGLESAFEFRRDDGHRFGVYLKAGDRVFLELFEGDTEGEVSGQSFRHICLEVEEIHEAVRELRARAVTVSDPKLGTDQSWQAWLSDPDGNRIELHQYTPESWQTPHLG